MHGDNYLYLYADRCDISVLAGRREYGGRPQLVLVNSANHNRERERRRIGDPVERLFAASLRPV